MAIIPQLSLFAWEEIEELGDLERLRLVLEHMPDEHLMQKLEQKRGKVEMTIPFVPCGMPYWPALCFNMTATQNFSVNCLEMGNFG
ncbi:MAG: hypothetical protein LOD92_04685 [Bacillales bacterium]